MTRSIRAWLTAPPPRVTAPLEDELPRRFLRVIVGIISCIAVVGLVGTWLGWNHIANREYARAISELRSAGLKLSPEQLGQITVDPNFNAAARVIEAAHELRYPAGQPQTALPRFYSQRIEPDERQWVEAFLNTNRQALQKVREARQLPAMILNDASLSREEREELMAGIHQLGAAVEAMARYHHRIGNDRAALEYIRDLFLIVRVIESRSDSAAQHDPLNYRSIANVLVENDIPLVRVGRYDMEATKDQLSGLISDLTVAKEFVNRAFAFDRASTLQRLEYIRTRPLFVSQSDSTTPIIHAVHGFAGPFYKLTAAKYLRGSAAMELRGGPRPTFAPRWSLNSASNVIGAYEIESTIPWDDFFSIYWRRSDLQRSSSIAIAAVQKKLAQP